MKQTKMCPASEVPCPTSAETREDHGVFICVVVLIDAFQVGNSI